MNHRFLFCSLMLLFLAGCVPPQSTFFWGNYSSTLYTFKKSPDAKTRDAHEKELLSIVTEAPIKHLRIPPGVCAEYGYLLIQDGKEKEGMMYLDKETELFPESTIFIQRLKTEYARGKQ